MKITTSLKKILKLQKKIRMIQGGQGAGKTIAILVILVNNASQHKKREIYIASEQLTKMRDTVIKDAIKVIESFSLTVDMIGMETGRPKIIFPNGSFIRFIGLDKEDVGKGLRSHVMYVNEANKINFETYRQLTSRAKNIYIDFNPDEKFWAHEHVQIRKDSDFLNLTFQDNEYLSEAERGEIMLYKELGYHSDGSIKSKYWSNKWRVYGLGEIGILEGAVYEDWSIVEKIPDKAELLGCGVDFGYSVPAAWIACYKFNGHYYFDQIIYEAKLTNQDLGEMIIASGLQDAVTYADNAEPKSIDEIYKMGIDIRPCVGKTDLVNFAVKKMNLKTFYVTQGSIELIEEFQKYIWDTDRTGKTLTKPRKKDDHAMNAVQYFVGSEGKHDGSY